MGKERKFKIKVSRQLSTHDVSGEISRDKLTRIVRESFRNAPPDIKEELEMMLQTVQYITHGIWATQVMEKDGSVHKCGCPLASISDWVFNDQWDFHPGASPGELTQGFRKYDRLMTRHFGIDNVYLRVV